MVMMPNIIVITTDQQRTDSIGCYGSSFVKTPNLDKIAAEGVRFKRAYCTNPVCTPSRVSIYSGKYVSSHGACNVGVFTPEDEMLLSHRLKKIGYNTHLIGKAHFSPYFYNSRIHSKESLNDDEWENTYPDFKGPYYGFDTVELAIGHTTFGLKGHYGCWVKEKLKGKDLKAYYEAETMCEKSFGGEAYDWDLPLELHNSLWTAERTIDYLNKMANSKQPFFLSIGFQDPHEPHAINREYAKQFNIDDIPLPDYDEGELDDKPPHFRIVHEGKLKESRFLSELGMAGQHDNYDYRNIPDKDARLGKAYYYGMVQLIDTALGKIMNVLDTTGLSENTLVIFTSDHGDLLGDHGIWQKGPFHYEQVIRVPLLIRWSGYIKPGLIEENVVSLVDIVPTVLAACCNNKIPNGLDGINLMPVLKGEIVNKQRHVIVECVDDPSKLRLKTIVSNRYKLTYYHGETFGELYDLENDPSEKKNLWNEHSVKDIKIELLNKLLDNYEKLEKRSKRFVHA